MMRRWSVGMVPVLVALALAPAAAAAESPPLEGECGPAEVPPSDPGHVLTRRAAHTPALDLCAATIDPVWDRDEDTERLTGLRLAIDVAGDLDERPPNSWYEFSGHYHRPNGEACSIELNYYDRPPGWEPFNAEVTWLCQAGGSDAILQDRTVWEYADVDPPQVSLAGDVLEAFIPFDGFTPWARSAGDELAAAGVLDAVQVSSGVHGHLPYRNPLPLLFDHLSGGGIQVRS